MNCHRRSTIAPSPFARKPLAIFTALISLGLPLTEVCADEEEQPSGATTQAAPLEVGSTVVTASGFSQDVRDAPASISVITREELENKQFRSLADAVRNVEGVSIIGGDKGEISIRGMESSHVLILIDGRRQNTSQVTLKGGTSEGLGMNWIPPVEAIDRIEVVRGPMSTLYGSEALGGVINVITRKVARQWSGSVSADHTFQDSSKAGDSTQLDGYVSGPLVEDRLGIQLWGYDKQRDEDKILNGFSKSTRHSGTARLWLTPDDQQEFMLEAGRTEQEFWNNPGKSLAPAAAKNNNQYTRDTYVLAHTGNWDFGTTDISLYREEATRASDVQTGNQSVTPEVTNSVFESKISLPFDRNVFVAGAQWKKDELEADGYYASPQGAGIGTSMTEKSLFAENEWSMTDSFSLTTGIRMDDNEFFGRHWTPRFYGVWHLNPDWTLKGGVAKGFKSPTITQTNPNIGLPQRGGAYTWGNPDLKPEESENREIGLYYDAGEIQRQYHAVRYRLREQDRQHRHPSAVLPGRQPGARGPDHRAHLQHLFQYHRGHGTWHRNCRPISLQRPGAAQGRIHLPGLQSVQRRRNHSRLWLPSGRRPAAGGHAQALGQRNAGLANHRLGFQLRYRQLSR